MTDIENIKAIVEAFDQGREALTKFAFTPTAPPAPPATAMPPQGPPPGDPNAMPPQDPNMMPPGDPNAMPPQDPNMMPPQDPNMAPPPGDPNAMPMPPQGPPPAGGVPPELEGALSQLAGGMDAVAQTVEEQQSQTDQLSQRMLSMEEEINNLRASLKGPAPFEGAPSTPADVPAPDAGAPTAR